ncbi:MAG: FAD-dependent oxidoreductase [Cyclobacteriaceae bacterium]
MKLFKHPSIRSLRSIIIATLTKGALAFCVAIMLINCSDSNPNDADIVIYGGTSAGVAAAIQASRMDKSVILIEPTKRLGGLTTGGLGQTDIGNKQAIGGIAREFYQNIKKYYEDPANWDWQKREEYKDGGQTQTKKGEDAMWTFEPSAALRVYDQMIEAENISIRFNQRLDRTDGVVKEGKEIVSITMESGETYTGKMFLDATYEGDLLATAGVSYTVGREANSEYNETLNGVQPSDTSSTITGLPSRNGYNHNFVKGVDPYVVAGDPSSGLLPYINPEPLAPEGTGDDKIQAYCYRMCLTDHPDNRIPFEKPANYDELNYELLFRNYEARTGEIRDMYSYGNSLLPWINSAMPNRKTDTNNKYGFSTDFIGQNYDYPEASYEERERIEEEHRNYQKGLMWSLANHPRIPEEVRKEASRWGTTKDEFEREDGWQKQLYVREARRMIGSYVMTQYNCEGIEVAEDPVGLGAYGMDSHNVQRYVTEEGFVRNEGNVEAKVKAPYPISYRSLIPKAEECTNLLVPVCLSATHIAFGSIRMEPVFMVLGQSAATAASLAIDNGSSVQDVPYESLNQQLLADKQQLQ